MNEYRKLIIRFCNKIYSSTERTGLDGTCKGVDFGYKGTCISFVVEGEVDVEFGIGDSVGVDKQAFELTKIA